MNCGGFGMNTLESDMGTLDINQMNMNDDMKTQMILNSGSSMHPVIESSNFGMSSQPMMMSNNMGQSNMMNNMSSMNNMSNMSSMNQPMMESSMVSMPSSSFGVMDQSNMMGGSQMMGSNNMGFSSFNSMNQPIQPMNNMMSSNMGSGNQYKMYKMQNKMAPMSSQSGVVVSSQPVSMNASPQVISMPAQMSGMSNQMMGNKNYNQMMNNKMMHNKMMNNKMMGSQMGSTFSSPMMSTNQMGMNQMGNNQMGHSGMFWDMGKRNFWGREMQKNDYSQMAQYSRPDRNWKPHTFGKMTLSVKEPKFAADFAVRFLGCKYLDQQKSSFNSIDKKNEVSVCLDGKARSCPTGVLTFKKFEDKAEEHKAFKEFSKQGMNLKKDGSGINPKVSWGVDSLDFIIQNLDRSNKRFFGPYKRKEDGLWQVVIEFPLHHYVLLNSYNFNKRIIDEINKRMEDSNKDMDDEYDMRFGQSYYQGRNRSFSNMSNMSNMTNMSNMNMGSNYNQSGFSNNRQCSNNRNMMGGNNMMGGGMGRQF